MAALGRRLQQQQRRTRSVSLLPWLLAVCCTMIAPIRGVFALSSLSSAKPRRGRPPSHRTNTPASQQQPQQRIAIIGGGVAGLACAQQVAKSSKYQVTVFDTGRLRPGGRCASRLPNDMPKNDAASMYYPILSDYRVDHAAQMIVVSPDSDDDISYKAFYKQLLHWAAQGLVQEFPQGSLYQITVDKEAAASIDPMVSSSYYYAPQGMSSIPAVIHQATVNATGNDDTKYELRQDVWVSPANGLRFVNKTREWQLSANGKSIGRFDKVIIAHNGKCADRLTSTSPAKLIHNLLRVRFAPTTPAMSQRMTLNSLYSLTFAVPRKSVLSQRLGSVYKCGMIRNYPDLTFLTFQTNKLQQSTDDNDNQQHEVWTILSSAAFATKHKAPQEFLPDDVIERVSKLLIESLEQCLDLLSSSSPLSSSILEKRLQLWGAALPLNVYRPDKGTIRGYLWDDKFQIGVCGDWLVEPSVRGAWTSGHQLGQALLAQQDHPPKGGAGNLKGSFQRSDAAAKAGIGALPAALFMSTAVS